MTVQSKIILVRHGETSASSHDLYYGRSDLELNSLGIWQAKRLAERFTGLAIAAIYTSPLRRARQTAEAILARRSLDLVELPGLIEIDYGRWEGMSRDEVSAKFGSLYEHWLRDPAACRPEGGETGYDVAARVVPEFRNLAISSEGLTVVVAHNTVNRVVLSHFLGMPLAKYREVSQAASTVNLLSLKSDGSIEVDCLNDATHTQDGTSGAGCLEKCLTAQ